MKVKVVTSFIDKYTKENYKLGAVLEVTKKRFEEINSTEYGILVKEIEEVEEKTIEVEEGKLVLPDFNTMTKSNIIKFAKDLMDIDLDMKMTRAEMIELLEK